MVTMILALRRVEVVHELSEGLVPRLTKVLRQPLWYSQHHALHYVKVDLEVKKQVSIRLFKAFVPKMEYNDVFRRTIEVGAVSMTTIRNHDRNVNFWNIAA